MDIERVDDQLLSESLHRISHNLAEIYTIARKAMKDIDTKLGRIALEQQELANLRTKMQKIKGGS